MSYFLRKVRKSAWDGGKEPSEEWWQTARAGFEFRAGEEAISVYVAEGPDDEKLIAAGLVCGKREEQPVDLLEISPEILGDFGEIVDEPGDTPIPQVNKMHRVLLSDGPRLKGLAEALRRQGTTARRHRWTDLRDVISSAINIDDVVGDHAEATKSFIARFKAKRDR